MLSVTKFKSAVLVATAILFGGLLTSGEVHADDLGGTWTKKSQKIRGAWSIVETADGVFLELDEAFKTRNAPDLKLFLSRNDAASVTASNATTDSILIAKLDRAKGAQRYRLPEGIYLAEFNSVLLHCEQYTKLWGVSALR
ncbi:MAG: DM13 domain-containing protein [Woeseiaceae bacterium]